MEYLHKGTKSDFFANDTCSFSGKGDQQMKNVEVKLDDDILTIKVDVTKEFGPSSSGKTIIIASTEGNVSIPEKDEIKIGLNVYKKKQ